MRFCSGSRYARAEGFSLLEALVSIAILAAIMTVFISSRTSPSHTLKVDQAIAEIASNVATSRLQAIRQRTVYEISLGTPSCNGEDQTVTLFPDGTGQSAPLCILVEGQQVHVAIDPFTSALAKVSMP